MARLIHGLLAAILTAFPGNWNLDVIKATLTYYGTLALTLSADGKHVHGSGYGFTCSSQYARLAEATFVPARRNVIDRMRWGG